MLASVWVSADVYRRRATGQILLAVAVVNLLVTIGLSGFDPQIALNIFDAICGLVRGTYMPIYFDSEWLHGVEGPAARNGRAGRYPASLTHSRHHAWRTSALPSSSLVFRAGGPC